MSISKKPFSTLQLAFGQIIFCAMMDRLTDDPAKGRHFTAEFERANVMHARIEGIKRSEDKESLVLDLVKVNVDGDNLNPVDEASNYMSINIPINQNDVNFTKESWSDDLVRVQALVRKINDETIDGIQTAVEAGLSMINLIKDAANVSGE